MYQQQSQDKKEVYRCEHHTKSFCVWRRTNNTTTSSTIVKKIEHIARAAVQRSGASLAIARRLMRCLNAGTAIALSARYPVEGIIGITAQFVYTRDMLTTVNQGTE